MSEEIEREATAPEVPATEPQADGEEYIYLPGVIADEFGVSRSRAREEVILGTVSIDGEAYDMSDNANAIDRLSIPKSACAGKTVEVNGTAGGGRHVFRFQIPDAA